MFRKQFGAMSQELQGWEVELPMLVNDPMMADIRPGFLQNRFEIFADFDRFPDEMELDSESNSSDGDGLLDIVDQFPIDLLSLDDARHLSEELASFRLPADALVASPSPSASESSSVDEESDDDEVTPPPVSPLTPIPSPTAPVPSPLSDRAASPVAEPDSPAPGATEPAAPSAARRFVLGFENQLRTRETVAAARKRQTLSEGDRQKVTKAIDDATKCGCTPCCATPLLPDLHDIVSSLTCLTQKERVAILEVLIRTTTTPVAVKVCLVSLCFYCCGVSLSLCDVRFAGTHGCC